MGIYEDEMFKYLTKPENFKAAKEICKILQQTENQLDIEVWQMIKDGLKKKLSNTELQIDDDLENIKKKEWDGICVSRDGSDFGIYLYEDEINVEKAYDRISKSEKNIGDNSEYPNWPRFIKNFFGFTQDKFLILPDVRDKLVKKYIDDIADYLLLVVDICDEVNKMRIKKK